MFVIKNKKSNFEMKKGYVSKAGNTLVGYYYTDDDVEFLEDGKGNHINDDLIAIFYRYYDGVVFYFEINLGNTAEASGLSLPKRLQCKKEVEEWKFQNELDSIYWEKNS